MKNNTNQGRFMRNLERIRRTTKTNDTSLLPASELATVKPLKHLRLGF